jgi:hypothetical protein
MLGFLELGYKKTIQYRRKKGLFKGERRGTMNKKRRKENRRIKEEMVVLLELFIHHLL